MTAPLAPVAPVVPLAQRTLSAFFAIIGNTMVVFLTRRILLGAFTIFVISLISFLIIQLPPGDFVDDYVLTLLGEQGLGTELGRSLEADLRVEFGLDRPMYMQYLKWLGKVVQGDFGFSLEFQKPVWDVVSSRLLNTVILAVAAIIFTWTLALPIGIWSAVRHNSPEDYTITFIGFLGLAIPDFLLALGLMWMGFFFLGLNVGGLFSREFVEASWSVARAWDMLKHLWIPALVLGTAGTATLVRYMRNNLLDELSKPYVVTARAKGLSEWRLVLKYPVRVALNPLISTVGYILPLQISGSIIVSVVLGLPTVGPLLLRALLSEDLFMAATIIMLLGAITVIGTLISDILLGLLDPRIRVEST